MARKKSYRKKKGKKKRTTKVDNIEETYKAAPHSFIFHRGHVGKNIKQLIKDARMVGEPFTARRLQVRKKNVLRDFVSVAGLLHVTHFMIFTKTDRGVYMRLCRIPQGPTLTFKVVNYCLTSDVVSSLKKPCQQPTQYLHHPLLVMNNFTGEGKHIKLMATMFQNMFPSINVHKVNLVDVRRCLLVNYNSDTKLIDFRHYNIKISPVGVSRKVKKLMQAKIPNLSKCTDISDYITQAGYTSSESEGELDGPHNEVILPQDVKDRGNIKSTKSAIRLTEIGPRMTLQLLKIEDGIANGEVLYHSVIHKTPEEIEQLKELREKKRKLKEARKQQQLANVKKKQLELEAHKQRSLAGMKRKQQEIDGDEVESPETAGMEVAEDDDVEYFREEVGVLPDKDANLSKGTKRPKTESHKSSKGQRKDNQQKPRGKLKENDSVKAFGRDGKNFKQRNTENDDGKKKKLKWSTMTIEQRNRAKKKLKEKKMMKKFGKKKRGAKI